MRSNLFKKVTDNTIGNGYDTHKAIARHLGLSMNLYNSYRSGKKKPHKSKLTKYVYILTGNEVFRIVNQVFEENPEDYASRAEMAREMGLRPQEMHHYYHGEHSPGMDTFRAMLDAVGYEMIFQKKERKSVPKEKIQ